MQSIIAWRQRNWRPHARETKRTSQHLGQPLRAKTNTKARYVSRQSQVLRSLVSPSRHRRLNFSEHTQHSTSGHNAARHLLPNPNPIPKEAQPYGLGPRFEGRTLALHCWQLCPQQCCMT